MKDLKTSCKTVSILDGLLSGKEVKCKECGKGIRETE